MIDSLYLHHSHLHYLTISEELGKEISIPCITVRANSTESSVACIQHRCWVSVKLRLDRLWPPPTAATGLCDECFTPSVRGNRNLNSPSPCKSPTSCPLSLDILVFFLWWSFQKHNVSKEDSPKVLHVKIKEKEDFNVKRHIFPKPFQTDKSSL